MCQRYLSISCVSSSSFPDVLSVLTFHVPTLMLFLVRSLFGPPVAYLSPPPWCAVEGAVLVDPGDDRAGMGWMVVVIHAVCLGQKSMAEPVPLHAGPQPISSNIWWLALVADTWPLSSSWNPSVLAGDFIVEVIRPVMQCQHHPLTWFSTPAETWNRGMARGASM